MYFTRLPLTRRGGGESKLLLSMWSFFSFHAAPRCHFHFLLPISSFGLRVPDDHASKRSDMCLVHLSNADSFLISFPLEITRALPNSATPLPCCPPRGSRPAISYLLLCCLCPCSEIHSHPRGPRLAIPVSPRISWFF